MSFNVLIHVIVVFKEFTLRLHWFWFTVSDHVTVQ